MAASTALHHRLVAGGFVHSIRRPRATAVAITDLMFQRSSYDVREALLVYHLRLTRFTNTAVISSSFRHRAASLPTFYSGSMVSHLWQEYVREEPLSQMIEVKPRARENCIRGPWPKSSDLNDWAHSWTLCCSTSVAVTPTRIQTRRAYAYFAFALCKSLTYGAS